MEIYPIIDPYAIHYDSFAGDVYTLDTAGITLTDGTVTASTLTDGTLIIAGGDLTSSGTAAFDSSGSFGSLVLSSRSIMDITGAILFGGDIEIKPTNFTGSAVKLLINQLASDVRLQWREADDTLSGFFQVGTNAMLFETRDNREMWFRTRTAHEMEFHTNNTERVTLTSTGDLIVFNNLKVGANAVPTVALDVIGAATIGDDTNKTEISATGVQTYFGTAKMTGLKINTVAKTAAYTATATDDVITCGAGNETFTITLPAVASSTGKVFHIKNVGTGTITIDGNAAETIDGAATATLTVQYECITIACDGTEWLIL